MDQETLEEILSEGEAVGISFSGEDLSFRDFTGVVLVEFFNHFLELTFTFLLRASFFHSRGFILSGSIFFQRDGARESFLQFVVLQGHFASQIPHFCFIARQEA